jgi:hypothetical protein
MASRAAIALLFLLSLARGCSHSASPQNARPTNQPRGGPPQVLAVYEAWFGHPRHLSVGIVGYSSHDPDVIRKQIRHAKSLGISGFVVDWYGYREPFIDRSYALMQSIAAEEKFQVAMMYDETDDEEGATDESIEDFKLFKKTYLAPEAPGRQAYLMYNGQPVIFIFPKRHTDWNRVRAEVNKWDKPPLLIDEYPPGTSASAMNGYYAWVSPVVGGNGSNWGEQYLTNFYNTMQSKYPDKIAVGGAWASFDDSKASWGLNRHIAPRCGQTMADTLNLWRQYSAQFYMPYLLIETWNDYEEGTAIEKGIPSCGSNTQQLILHSSKSTDSVR